jgi:hypothetical protein
LVAQWRCFRLRAEAVGALRGVVPLTGTASVRFSRPSGSHSSANCRAPSERGNGSPGASAVALRLLAVASAAAAPRRCAMGPAWLRGMSLGMLCDYPCRATPAWGGVCGCGASLGLVFVTTQVSGSPGGADRAAGMRFLGPCVENYSVFSGSWQRNFRDCAATVSRTRCTRRPCYPL